GHVHVDADGGCGTSASEGHQENPGDEVVDIGRVAAQACAHGTAEDKDEEEQHDRRCPDAADRHHGVAPQVPEVAPKHGGGITQGVGAHGPGSFSVTGWPVSAKKTSSRSGVCTTRLATSM